MRVLFFGDIFGRPGREAIAASISELKQRYRPDIILGNVENLAGGRGVNRKSYDEMLRLGFHGFTSGNHIWDNKEVYAIMENDPRLIRPANYPAPCPGVGAGLIEGEKASLFVINLMGRVFMDAIDCPFHAVDRILAEAPPGVPIFVDMHAETTSEKYAMGWHLAGRVAAVVGTHTHIQTADARILPVGTAYITDVGMTGSFDSVIGASRLEIIRRFQSKRPVAYQISRENPGVSCVLVDIGSDHRATGIERFRFEVSDVEMDRDLE